MLVFCSCTDEQMALKKQQIESAKVLAYSEKRSSTQAGPRSNDRLSGVSHDTEPFLFLKRCVKYMEHGVIL